MDALKLIAQDSIKAEKPVAEVGDTVRVDVKIREGDRERIQAFEGTVIAKRGSGVSETFTVRRVSYGVGVERVFPVHSPNVAAVKVVRYGKVRRAKLYYLRDRVGRLLRLRKESADYCRKVRADFISALDSYLELKSLSKNLPYTKFLQFVL